MAVGRGADVLAHLSPDQLEAATAAPGPVLCVAPAGSGKTTTLVARISWRIVQGSDPGAICALTFNRRAADELRGRLDVALRALGVPPGSVRVRTFHALGLEILREAGAPVEPLLDRTEVLVRLSGATIPAPMLRQLDDAFSRFKLDQGLDAEGARAELAAMPRARDGSLGGSQDSNANADDAGRRRLRLEAFIAYEAELERLGGLDFDDLVARALRALTAEASLLERWRARCRVLFVDEVQDLDRSQLRLATRLAAPTNDCFMVGDDDQTIYAWRLADVRRILGLAASLPGLRRVDLVTNRRCPPAVVDRAARLVAHNRERFDKRILAAPTATGDLVLRPDPTDDVTRARSLLATWAPALRRADPPSHAVLARTNRELAPYAAAALELGLPYRAEEDGLEALDDAETAGSAAHRGHWSVGRGRWHGARRRRSTLPLRLGPRSVGRTHRSCSPPRTARRASSSTWSPASASKKASSRAPAPWPRLRPRGAPWRKSGGWPTWRGRGRGAALVLVYDPGAPSPFLQEAFTPDELRRAWHGQDGPR